MKMSQQHRREVDGLSSGEEEQLKIEAEIERLLLHAGVDAEENAEAMPHDTTKVCSYVDRHLTSDFRLKTAILIIP